MATAKNSNQKQAEDFVKNAFESFSQNINALSGFTKETVDAMVKNSGKTSKNVEEIVSEVMNCTKSNIENCVSSAKDLASARSVDQLISIQTEQSKKYFDTYVSQMSKISELCLNLSKDVTTPMSEQATAFSEKFMKKAA